jgi:Protein of unknown function (DUF1553)/Protein of unknown function (DUF1549)/Planctomycete cytochrome C
MRRRKIRRRVFAGMLLSALPLAAADSPASADFFENKIRPILATQCFACHTTSQLGGLRLDSREAMLKGGTSGPSIAPGDPDKSLLITAVQQTTNLKMPKGAKLKPDEIAALKEWVKAGAAWPAAPKVVQPQAVGYVIRPEQRSFWSFQPLHPTPAPALKNPDWAKTEIDRYILARLEQDNLTPVAAADKRRLLRRASMDLTGLPPAPEDLESFEKDNSREAFAKVVDRLLASPQYGERWGRLWLDVARYGEDDYRSLDPMGRGYAPYQNAYLYRDWVIQAFNDDLPYDHFVKAQLAADFMDEKVRVKMLPALGFLGQGLWFYDNGAVEITRADERHDRVDVVTRGFLGLTVACARCHDHKYDPIPTQDYYSLTGVFANTRYHEYPQVPKAVVADYKAQEKKAKDKQKFLGEFMTTESQQLGESLAMQISKYMQAAWRVTGEPKDDLNKVVDDGKLDYELMQRYLKFLAKPPTFYPYLKDWQELIKRGGKTDEAKKLADEFQALVLEVMFEKKEMKDENDILIAKALQGTKKKEPFFKPSDFVTNDDFCPNCGVEVKSMPPDRNNLWTDVFQRDLDGSDPILMFQRFKPGLLAFRGWGLERQLSAERRIYLAALREEIANTRKSMPAEYPYIHGVADVEKPSDVQVNVRGNPFNLAAVAPRGFLQVLSKDEPLRFSKGSGREELAEAIVQQPLAARVIVNRVWKWHFGTGLVNTPSNFGLVGERPSHPELLEYLADFFVRNGMSIKKLHREIMLSAVYQESDEFSQADFDKDSGNRLYWRANRRRMDAEQIRDSLLAVAGALDKKMYGPSETLTPWLGRRTVYGKVSRYKLDEYLQLFDFPSPNMTAEQRYTTNVPLQRLFFMNSDFMQQQGELLARRVAEEPTTQARIEKAYRLVFGRAPTPEEVRIGIDYLKAEPMKEYEEQKAEAEKKSKEKAEKSAKTDGSHATDPVKGGLEVSPPDDGMPAMEEEGMMAGVSGKPVKEDVKKEKLLPVTAWGRYAKILLSSTEFTFID